MSIKTSKWDTSDYLETPEDVVAYLNTAVGEDDPACCKPPLAMSQERAE